MGKVLDILKSVNAIIMESHIVLTSGRHASIYINKDALYPHTKETSEVCKLMAEKAKGLEVDVVVGPALGGIVLSQWTAHHLSKMEGTEVLGVYTEKTEDGGQKFTRGYEKFVKGKRILVVEDLASTGGSVKKVIAAVQAAGGEAVGVCVMVNRNPKEVNEQFFGAPFFPLDVLEVESFEEGQCPLCEDGIPINESVGHGKEFLEKLKAKR
jgi:orotate phosphoribosyltransferase